MDKILIVHDCDQELSGGAFVLQDTIRRELDRDAFSNSLILCHRSQIHSLIDSVVGVYSLTPVIPSVKQKPLALTVWDTGHLQYPSFPEYQVEKGGWPAVYRDQYYRDRLSEASFVVTGSEVGKLNLQREYRIHPSNIVVNPFPVDALRIQNKNVSRDANLSIFYPANFWPHKNHILLIEALSKLRYRNPEVILHLTGADKGNLQYIKNMIQAYDLQSNVHIHGFVSREKLMNLYSQCGLFIFPSLLGPDNLPPLEAISKGCKVAVADILGVRDIYGDKVFYFDPYDSETLAERILSWLGSDPITNIPEGFATSYNYVNTIKSVCKRLVHLSRLAALDYREI